MIQFKKQQGAQVHGTLSPTGKQIIARGLRDIEGMAGKAQAVDTQQAIEAVRDMAGIDIGDVAGLPGLGASGSPSITGGTQHHDASKYSIPTLGMPSNRDLTGQDGDSPTMTHSEDGASDGRHGSVWVERRTERSSADGSHTWGSATYRDWSGNFWRSDYQIDHNSDGGTTSKDTVFDNHNEAIKTTVIDTAPDGTEKVTTTDHQTGQTTTTVGQVKPEEPPEEDAGGKDKGGATKNQGETTGLMGGAFHPKQFVNPNKVNPGPEGNDQQPATPVQFDRSILVTDPLPDEAAARGNARPRDIQGGNVNIDTTDPPRPIE